MTERRTLDGAVARTLAVCLTAALLSACSDRRESTAPRAIAPGKPANLLAVADTSSWNSYGADITLVVKRARATGKMVPVPESRQTYHMTRNLLAGGNWQTVLSFDPPSRPLPSAAAAQRAAGWVSRVEDDGDGSAPRLYNGGGQLVAPPPRSIVIPGAPSVPSPLAPSQAGSRIQHKPYDRSVIQSLILAPETAADRRAAFRRAFGQPTAASTAAREEYSAQHGESLETIVIDPTIAAPIEVTEQRAGSVILHVTLAYDMHEGGVATLNHVTTERGPSPTGLTHTSELSFQNVRLLSEQPGR